MTSPPRFGAVGPWCPGRVLLAGLVLSLGMAGPLAAQSSGELAQRIQESQQRLEEIRAERERLQRDMQVTRTRVENVSAELRNIERQLSASRAILAELELQSEATASRVEDNSRELILTRERLRTGAAVLNRRLRDIYKLGALHSVRVLLGAESVADLLNRYRYLRLMARYDRALVLRVGELEAALAAQNTELQQSLRDLGLLRQTKLSEVSELRSVEQDRQATLARFRSREVEAQGRLEQLEADLGRLSELVDELEVRRVEAERRRAEEGRRTRTASLSAGDAGALAWPVEGGLLYRFGRERRPDGTVLRWNGIGIGAPPGTPVRAVKDGTVVLAGPFEGYGPTVILSHGDGFYTLYLYLEEIGVVEGRPVVAGQVVGTVGGAETPEGPHLEFQIRAPGANGGSPVAQDPLEWLRAQGGR